MDESDQLMTIEQLAEYLGLKTRTLYNWRNLRTGPRGFRVGRNLRYRVSEVQRWLAEQERSAA